MTPARRVNVMTTLTSLIRMLATGSRGSVKNVYLIRLVTAVNAVLTGSTETQSTTKPAVVSHLFTFLKTEIVCLHF